MKRKTIIIISSILLLGVLLCIPFYFFYFKKAVIYDLVNIEFNGIAPKEISAIKIYGITPAEKKILIYKRSDAKDIPGCFQSIEIVIPDTLISKISSIRAVLKEKEYRYKISELPSRILSENTHIYILPPEVKSEGKFFNKLFSTYPFKVFLSILKIFFLSAFVILILFLIT